MAAKTPISRLPLFTSLHPTLAGGLLVLAAVCVFTLGPAGGLLGGAAAGSRGREAAEGSFWLVVEIRFKSPDDLTEFYSAFKPLAEYVRDHEPHTISYQLAKSDSDPLKIVLLERYKSRVDYAETHKSSSPFKAFRPKIDELGAEISGHSYQESSIGFV